jgi:hypothetical protein
MNKNMAENKITREKQTIRLLIWIYCRRAEGNKELCHACLELLSYAHAHLDRCSYGNDKPDCK